MSNAYIKVTQEAGQRFLSKQHSGPIVMLNLLKFRSKADYSEHSELAPQNEITGSQAYKLYMKSVQPMLAQIGSEVIFSGKADHFLIGPQNEKWDAALLVRHQNMKDFMAFAVDEAYLKIEGHRTAALADSRLMPIEEGLLF